MPRRRVTDTESIVAAAVRVFDRKGYREATLDDVAAEAGVSKPTVYQYAKSKLWLLETILERAIYPLEEQAREVIAAPGTAVERLEVYVDLSVRAAIRNRMYYSVLISDESALSPTDRKRFRQWAHAMDARVEDLLKNCVVEGSVRGDIDLGMAARLLNSQLTSIHRWYRPGGRLNAEQIAAEVKKYLRGLVTA
jgi:AcrR family transcriptional regulator